MKRVNEKKEVVVEEKSNATITRVHPSGRMVFVKMEGVDRERPVPVARLTQKKDEYKVGDEVVLDFPRHRGLGSVLSEEKLKEREERIATRKAEIEKSGADIRLTEAVILLAKARSLVADYVESVCNAK